MFSHASTIFIEQLNSIIDKATRDLPSMNHASRQRCSVFDAEEAQLRRFTHMGFKAGRFHILFLEIARNIMQRKRFKYLRVDLWWQRLEMHGFQHV